MSEYKIRRTWYEPTLVRGRHDNRLRIRLTIDDVRGEGLTTNVLVVRRVSEPGNDPPYSDQFQAVADPHTISAYPVGAPDPDNHYPDFLVSEVTLRLRSREDVEAYKVSVDAELSALMAALESTKVLYPSSQDWLPEAPTESASNSES